MFDGRTAHIVDYFHTTYYLDELTVTEPCCVRKRMLFDFIVVREQNALIVLIVWSVTLRKNAYAIYFDISRV